MTASRTKERVKNNLGIIYGGMRPSRHRSEHLKKLSDYYYCTQHDDKIDWFEAEEAEISIPIRNRKPIVNYPLAKIHVARIVSKLLGDDVFPEIQAEDESQQEIIDAVLEKIDFKEVMKDFAKKVLAFGSGFIRIKIVEGHMSLTPYDPNYCYPTFAEDGSLETMRIQYVYTDGTTIDKETKKPVERWFRLDLTKEIDVLYDNPIFKDDTPPTFKVVNSESHSLGVVQGHWCKNTKLRKVVDGDSVIEDILDLSDCISYNISRSDQAADYGTDPQVVISGLDESELDELEKSSTKAWALGREGTAQMLEVGGAGVTAAGEMEDRLQRKAQEVTNAIMHDPEKIVGSAQSAKAMEVLNGPLVDAVKDLRPIFEYAIKTILLKILILLKKFIKSRKEIVGLDADEKLIDLDSEIKIKWGEIFPPTMQDLQAVVSVYSQLVTGNLMSRKTALANLAKYFDYGDLEEEMKLIETQKQFNTFNQF